MQLIRAAHLPNAITVARVLMVPAIVYLIFVPGFAPRLAAFSVFLVAALSDLCDGYLARRFGWISDFGKLLDPIADKLLLAATLIPIFLLSHRPDALGVGPLPYWGTLPLWVLLVILAREVLVTVLRVVAANRGVVLAAGSAGKHKTATQNVFIGAALLWYAFEGAVWESALFAGFRVFHGLTIAGSLAVAVVLTVYSLMVYLWQWQQMRR